MGFRLISKNTLLPVEPWGDENVIGIFHTSANMVTALLLSTVPLHFTPHRSWTSLLHTNQKFHHKFSVFECMKIAQNYAQVSFTFVSTLSSTPKLINLFIYIYVCLFIYLFYFINICLFI